MSRARPVVPALVLAFKHVLDCRLHRLGTAKQERDLGAEPCQGHEALLVRVPTDIDLSALDGWRLKDLAASSMPLVLP
jgi:hypothetical protein